MTRILALALLLGGCVYYNGMYNTKRLAGSAQRAEREGRTFEANDLWGQVVTRAESLVVRHPTSKYADEALVYKGVALARLGQCPAAIAPLGRAQELDLDGDIAEEAALALGVCQIELGDPAPAELALSRAAESDDRVRRREALVHLARARRLAGRPEQAIAALEDVPGRRASEERLLALAAAGRAEPALALLDTLLASSDSALSWDSTLAVVGRTNPALASEMVDRVGRHPSSTPAARARRLLEDAARLEATDSARAVRRLREASRMAAGTEFGTRANIRLLLLEVRRAESPADLPPLADSLRQLFASGGNAGQEAFLVAQTLMSVASAADSSGPDVPQGDLRLFLVAETARDSLRAPRVAAALFRRIVETWPDSPYAPKALLAGLALDPTWGEEARWLLDYRYASSPYLAFVRGEEPVGYRELEDSLRLYVLSGSATPADPGARRAPAAAPVPPDDLPGQPGRPGGNRRPANTRVPLP